jgi:hypothetical protein
MDATEAARRDEMMFAAVREYADYFIMIIVPLLPTIPMRMKIKTIYISRKSVKRKRQKQRLKRNEEFEHTGKWSGPKRTCGSPSAGLNREADNSICCANDMNIW